VEEIWRTHIGRGTQHGNPVSGNIKDTTSDHSVDGRRWDPNSSYPSSWGEEDSSICEKTILDYLNMVDFHPVTETTDDQSHPVTRSERVNKEPHLRTIHPDIVGRIGGS
jgi:hypothetical protein